MPLSESKIRSWKPLLTSHHSDSIIMVLQTKAQTQYEGSQTGNCLCQFQSQIGPKSACHRQRNLFYNVRDAHENAPPPHPPPPPLVVYEVSGSIQYSLAASHRCGGRAFQTHHIPFDPKVFAQVDVTCFQMCEIHVKNTLPCSVHGIISFLVYYRH